MLERMGYLEKQLKQIGQTTKQNSLKLAQLEKTLKVNRPAKTPTKPSNYHNKNNNNKLSNSNGSTQDKKRKFQESEPTSSNSKRMKPIPLPQEFKLTFFADGSCSGHNKGNTTTCKTGWAFKFLFPLKVNGELKHYEIGHKVGTVVVDRISQFFIGAEQTTSNTAELTAVCEIFRLFLYPPMKMKDLVKAEYCGKIKIFTDSKFVVNVLSGVYKPKKNKVLVNKSVEWKGKLKAKGFSVEIEWIKGHIGYTHHTDVDGLAYNAFENTGVFQENSSALEFVSRKVAELS